MPQPVVEKDVSQSQAVIKQRMAEARICDDVALFKGQEAPDALGLIGGFPCQGISVAGEQLGMDDTRSSLVCHAFRVYDELTSPKKRFILLENVLGLISRKLQTRAVLDFMKACAVLWLDAHMGN